MKKRAIRRHHTRRLKAKARRRIERSGRFSNIIYETTEKNIGRHYQVHGAFCSNALCRYLKSRPGIQEKRNDLRWSSEKEEIN
jgi:hypothetical protein